MDTLKYFSERFPRRLAKAIGAGALILCMPACGISIADGTTQKPGNVRYDPHDYELVRDVTLPAETLSAGTNVRFDGFVRNSLPSATPSSGDWGTINGNACYHTTAAIQLPPIRTVQVLQVFDAKNDVNGAFVRYPLSEFHDQELERDCRGDTDGYLFVAAWRLTPDTGNMQTLSPR